MKSLPARLWAVKSLLGGTFCRPYLRLFGVRTHRPVGMVKVQDVGAAWTNFRGRSIRELRVSIRECLCIVLAVTKGGWPSILRSSPVSLRAVGQLAIVTEYDKGTMSTLAITIDGYLTESKLSKALQQLLPDRWMGDQISVAGSRRRWDISYQLGDVTPVVEYDGDEHYRHSMKVKADRAKDDEGRLQGCRVVRFPYWIQLDNLTLKHFFSLEAQVKQSFPHGFITTKIFPASFCELGVKWFRTELLSLPLSIRESVILSLRDRVAEHGLQYVLPTSLADIFDD
jgi:hypothetical protein